MPTLPTDVNDSPNYTSDDHATHHNTVHGLNNQLGNFTQATAAPGSPASGDLWLDTDEYAAPSGSTGLLLAAVNWVPGADVQVAGTSFADVDATNAAITFTAPSTGKVLVRASALVESVANIHLYWGLREGTNNLAGTESKVNYNAGATQETRPNYEVIRTGLTPGNTYTYKVAHRVNSGTSAFVMSGFPVVLTVWSAP